MPLARPDHSDAEYLQCTSAQSRLLWGSPQPLWNYKKKWNTKNVDIHGNYIFCVFFCVCVCVPRYGLGHRSRDDLFIGYIFVTRPVHTQRGGHQVVDRSDRMIIVVLVRGCYGGDGSWCFIWSSLLGHISSSKADFVQCFTKREQILRR